MQTYFNRFHHVSNMTVVHHDCECFWVIVISPMVFEPPWFLEHISNKQSTSNANDSMTFVVFFGLRDLKSYTHDRSMGRMVYLPSFGWSFWFSRRYTPEVGMVGRWSFPFGFQPIFRGELLNFQGGYGMMFPDPSGNPVGETHQMLVTWLWSLVMPGIDKVEVRNKIDGRNILKHRVLNQMP